MDSAIFRKEVLPRNLLTGQEKLLIHGTPDGGNPYVPEAFLRGVLPKDVIVTERNKSLVVSASSLDGFGLRTGINEGVIRMRLMPVDPDTLRSIGDPRIEHGKIDAKTGDFTAIKDVTSEYLRDYKKLDPESDILAELHLREDPIQASEEGGTKRRVEG